jgi:hypothetical protein
MRLFKPVGQPVQGIPYASSGRQIKLHGTGTAHQKDIKGSINFTRRTRMVYEMLWQ